MRIWLTNGNNATTDAENALLLRPHFAKVCCSDWPVDWSALDEVRQRDAMQEIDQPILRDELNPEVTKFKNDKAIVLNKVPLNDFKPLNNYNLSHLLDFFITYWLEETDFDEWHEGQIVPVPKSGDLPDT